MYAKTVQLHTGKHECSLKGWNNVNPANVGSGEAAFSWMSREIVMEMINLDKKWAHN